MTETSRYDKAARQLKLLSDALNSGRLGPVRRMVNTLSNAEIARLLESLPTDKRLIVWGLVDPEDDGEVLVEVSEEVRAGLIEDMDPDELIAATQELDIDDLAELLEDLPDTVISEVLKSMDRENRERLEHVLSYPEDTAGRLTNPDVVTVRADVTVDVVLRYLRMRAELPDLTDHLFVVNRRHQYLGRISLAKLVTTDPETPIGELIDDEVPAIRASTSLSAVASEFEDHNLVSAAVVDDSNTLVGRITIDDVVDIIRAQADHQVFSRAGLDEEEDIFSPVVTATRRRALWLGVNLLTAFLASWVIGNFERALEQIVALAVLMPVVASMGGIAGSQTLTLIVRGLAVGQVSGSNARALLSKELAVGVLNGILWAVVVGTVSGLWFSDWQLAGVIGAAVAINLAAAALAGVTIPLILRRLAIDPALAGGVVLTTVTDVVGFLAFLGLGTWLLL